MRNGILHKSAVSNSLENFIYLHKLKILLTLQRQHKLLSGAGSSGGDGGVGGGKGG
jgi:hypothetical protein